jgi:hypothetical protein
MALRSNRFRITIQGEEADGSIRLTDLLDQLNAVKATLNQVDAAVSGQKSPSLYYRVTNITMNSPATFEVEAVPTQRSTPAHGRKVVAKFNRDLKTVIAGKRPKDANLELLESYGAMAQPMRKYIAQVSIQFDDDTNAVDVPRNLGLKVDEILGPDQVEVGSIIGSLDVIDVHNQRNMFKVYPAVGPASVKCQFPKGMLGAAVAGIERFVRISGELHFKKTEKYPHYIKVSKIEVLPERSDAAPLSSLRGIASGALRGMSSSEYVDRVRNDGW